MPFEIYQVPHNHQLPITGIRLLAGQAMGMEVYTNSDVEAIVFECAEDDSEVSVYRKWLGDKDADYVVEKADVIVKKYLKGSATKESNFLHNVVNKENAKYTFIVRYAGKIPLQPKNN
jgi:hypothetical protein